MLPKRSAPSPPRATPSPPSHARAAPWGPYFLTYCSNRWWKIRSWRLGERRNSDLADRAPKGCARPRGQVRVEDLVSPQRRPAASCVYGDAVAARRLDFADGGGIFFHRHRIILRSPGVGRHGHKRQGSHGSHDHRYVLCSDCRFTYNEGVRGQRAALFAPASRCRPRCRASLLPGRTGETGEEAAPDPRRGKVGRGKGCGVAHLSAAPCRGSDRGRSDRSASPFRGRPRTAYVAHGAGPVGTAAPRRPRARARGSICGRRSVTPDRDGPIETVRTGRPISRVRLAWLRCSEGRTRDA